MYVTGKLENHEIYSQFLSYLVAQTWNFEFSRLTFV